VILVFCKSQLFSVVMMITILLGVLLVYLKRKSTNDMLFLCVNRVETNLLSWVLLQWIINFSFKIK